MKIENENGDLLWAPNNFGTYSVEKTKEITDIISNVLSDLTINVHQQIEEDFGDYYNKDEINAILRDYLLRADYSDTAGPAIRSATNEYLESLRNAGTIVDSSVTEKLMYAADFWTRCCLNMSYSELINAQVAPSVTSFASRLDNLEGIQNSHSTYLNKIIQNMYEDTETRTGLLLSTRAFTGEGQGVVIGTGNNTYNSLTAAVNYLLANSQTGTVSSLTVTVNSLSSEFLALKSDVVTKSGDVVTTSTNSNDKVPSARLEYQDRQNISSLSSQVSSLSSQLSTVSSDLSTLSSTVSTLQTKVTSLETDLAAVKQRVSSLETRVSALENANNG